MKTSRNVSIDWNEHSVNFRESLMELRENDHFLDVTLVCDDDIQIKAHKNILSVSSNFFRNVLRKNPHPHPLIYLKGLEHSDLLAMVEFMYSGKVEIAQDNLDRFLASAQDLKIKGLFDMEENPVKKTASILDTNEKSDLRKPLETNSNPFSDIDSSKGIVEEFVTPSEVLDMNVTAVEDDDVGPDTPSIENKSVNIKTESFLEDSNKIDPNDKIASLIEKKDKLWHCKVCGKTTKQICQVKSHVQTHIEGISVDCSYCGKSYRSSSVLSAHKTKCRRSRINETVKE